MMDEMSPVSEYQFVVQQHARQVAVYRRSLPFGTMSFELFIRFAQDAMELARKLQTPIPKPFLEAE